MRFDHYPRLLPKVRLILAGAFFMVGTLRLLDGAYLLVAVYMVLFALNVAAWWEL